MHHLSSHSMITLGIFYILLIVVTPGNADDTSTDLSVTVESVTSSNSTVRSTGSSIQKQSIIIPFSIIKIAFLALKYIN
ncbi:unnamed protein product [Rotaria sordida]|uniref:Uncharacterized protein n=1 Tax=Rotaria sordida TaxID=392033 RepID=A0A818VFM3_9BILA|nr:unnamed protein product [Rotaria sordida]